MRYYRKHLSATTQIVTLAVWLCLNALGSAGLHELISCSHDQKTETIAHHETESAHWAGLETEASTDTSCSVCTVSKQTAIHPDRIVQKILIGSDDPIIDDNFHFVFTIRHSVDQPRAPFS